MFAFVELAVSFAVPYLSLPKEQLKFKLGWLDAVYFSFVTFATLGYGDIKPSGEARLAKIFVMTEIVLGLYFLAVILANLVSWANPRSGLPSISDLCEESRKLAQDKRRYTLPPHFP